MQIQPSLGLAQRQQLTLTPQVRQALHVLQCSSQELAQEIGRILAENPLLEPVAAPEDSDAPLAEWPAHWPPALPRTVSDDIPEPAQSLSLADYLLQQLHVTRLEPRDVLLVSLLIAELDERGYLDFDPQRLSRQLPTGVRASSGEWRVALRLLQSFDPPGIAARDLAECLRLQLQARRAQWPASLLARALDLTAHLDALAVGHWDLLCQRLACSRAELEDARAVLRALDPRPAQAWQPVTTHYVVPDVLARPVRGQWQVAVNPAVERPLRLCPDLVAGLAGTEVSPALHAQLQSARGLLQSLAQRRQTILRVTECILQYQPGFLAVGVSGLRPLTQKEVAQALDLHESTVSRATRLKYLQTPWGVFELRRFFGAGVATPRGGEVAAEAVQALMRGILAAESPDRPLSDMQLARALGERGVTIARRTVAKYREALGVLPASLRRR